MMTRPPSSPLFPYTTLFRSVRRGRDLVEELDGGRRHAHHGARPCRGARGRDLAVGVRGPLVGPRRDEHRHREGRDRKSTRLNSSHLGTSYAVFCLKKKKISEDLIRRARDAGIGTLVLTVDVPVASKRERNIRNGFGRPLKMSLHILLEALTHPEWMSDYLRHGTPLMENWAPYAPPGSNADQVADFVSSQMPSVATWDDLEKFRKLLFF